MPAPAVGFAPLAIVSGGQNFAQAPVHTMCPFFSLVMWYSVRPPAFTTSAPYLALFVLLTVPLCAPVAATATPAPTAARTASGTTRRASRVHIVLRSFVSWVFCPEYEGAAAPVFERSVKRPLRGRRARPAAARSRRSAPGSPRRKRRGDPGVHERGRGR